MAKKAKVKRCVECPYCVDVSLSDYDNDFKCSYSKLAFDNESRDIDNALVIQDWCQLEGWEDE